MCVACFKISCLDVTGCVNGGSDPTLAVPPEAVVRDYTALLAYFEYEQARFNAMMPTVGAQVFVTYSFNETAELPDISTDPYDSTAYWAFDAAQRENTRLAMAELSRVSGVTFVETTGTEAMLQVFGADATEFAGYASYPWVTGYGTGQGRMVINQPGDFRPGSTAFQVILHELGHAVGLKHPFSGDLTLASDLDNTSQTLMSYTWSGPGRSVFSPLDVQALEHIYGAARDNTGWTWEMDGAVFRLTAASTADVLIGVRTANVINGKGGADQIFGNGLGDTLSGGAGNDTIVGGRGENRLLGGAGRDLISGGDAVDRMLGGDGNDSLTGDSGGDRIWGDAGGDRIWGDLDGEGWGTDQIYGGDGNDTIYGGGDSDRVWGDAGDDRIWGDFAADGWGEDTIYGGAGNDWIHGGTGNNVLHGGDGDDTILGGDFGNMLITGGNGNDVLYGQVAGAGFGGFDTIDGGAGDDRIYGEAGSDSLTGAGGKDSIFGGLGWDTLDGGASEDRLYGGGDGDILYGGLANDTLDGGSGSDDLFGGAGRDRLTGGEGSDFFAFVSADLGWTDVITDFEVGVDYVSFVALGFARSSLRIVDHANGTDSVLSVGPAAELSVQLLGVRAADFDLFDVFI